jgi:hypothetical protein
VLDLGLWIAKLVKRLNGDPGLSAGSRDPSERVPQSQLILQGLDDARPPSCPSYLTAKRRDGSSNRRVIVGGMRAFPRFDKG